jgi:hypothetical protein
VPVQSRRVNDAASESVGFAGEERGPTGRATTRELWPKANLQLGARTRESDSRDASKQAEDFPN